MATGHAPTRTPERQQFYDRIAPANLAPLWEQLHSLVTPAPVPKALPAVWRYRDVRPFLMQSGSLITAQEATRRVLMLMNPGLGGQASITGSLFAGLQLMAPGDFVITPSWTWHDHGNDTAEPMVWLDGLDVQIVNLLNTSFAENFPDDTQPVSRPEGDSFARYGNNLLPIDWKPEVKTSPVFNYPYARTREALAALTRNGACDPYHGHKLRYVNPASGAFAMPTIATFVQLLPAGFASLPYRATDGTVFVCVEGEGETRVSDTVLPWEKHDIFVVPSWASHTHHASRESVLFSFSDRAVQEKLGLWREARGNA